MPPAIVQFQKREEAKFICSACGADRGCQCHAPAIPKAVRAAEAVKANPEKSDRAIAADIGMSDSTVQRARKATASDEAVERIGLDGKTRRLPAKPAKPEALEEEDSKPVLGENGTDIGITLKDYFEIFDRANKQAARISLLVEALNAKEAQASRNWPADMKPRQIKHRDKCLHAIAWWQRELEQLYGEVTGRPSWRVEVTTKDGKRLGTGARFGTRGEAEFYNANFAATELGDDYASGEIIACETEKANVTIHGNSLRFRHGDCVLLNWALVEQSP